MTAQLDLADDLWCLGFDPLTNHRELNESALALGLAGALVIELVATGHATVVEDYLTGLDARPAAPAEPEPDKGKPETIPLIRVVWNAVMEEEYRFTVKTWLGVLAKTAIADVTERLSEKGILAYNHNDVMRTNYRVGERSRAENRVRHSLTNYRRGYYLSPQDEFLVGLANAIGLGRLTSNLDDDANEYHAWVLANLGTNYPVLANIVATTHIAVAESVLTSQR